MRAMRFVLLLSCLVACSGDTSYGTEADDLGAGKYENPLLRAQDGTYAECPDPNVKQFGANYFMVCTSPKVGQTAQAFPIHWSSDLVHWHFIGHVFSAGDHPSWALPPGAGGVYWAPELNRIDGKWHLVFAAKTSNPSKHGSLAIGVATADAIAGPWNATGSPIVSQGDGSIPGPGDGNSGRIDPSIVRDPKSGDLFLYYIYQPHYVHVAKMTADGLGVVKGSDKGLFETSQAWEETTVEGVEAHARDGKIVLLYSGASTWDGTYAVGAARADSPYGPFDKHQGPILSSSSSGKLVGPGHSSQWVTGPDGKTWLLYHVQRRGQTGHSEPRLLALDELTFDGNGWPKVGNGHPSESPRTLP